MQMNIEYQVAVWPLSPWHNVLEWVPEHLHTKQLRWMQWPVLCVRLNVSNAE